MLPEQNPQTYEKRHRLVEIKDAFVQAGRSVMWQEVGTLMQCEDIVGSEDRFERSWYYGGVDYGGLVFNVLNRIVERDSRNELKLVQYAIFKLSRSVLDAPIRDRLRKIEDYLEVCRVIEANDLPEQPRLVDYIDRFEQTLFNGLEATPGGCKDLIDSALKTILNMPDHKLMGYTMPKLMEVVCEKLTQVLSDIEHDKNAADLLNNLWYVTRSVAKIRNMHITGRGRAPSIGTQLTLPYVLLETNALITVNTFLTQVYDLKTYEVFVGLPSEQYTTSLEDVYGSEVIIKLQLSRAARRPWLWPQPGQQPPLWATAELDTSWFDDMKSGPKNTNTEIIPDDLEEGEDLPW